MAERQPTVIRITRTDSSRIVVYQPAVRGDSIVGRGTAPRACEVEALCPTGGEDSAGYLAVPLAGVQSLAVKRFNLLKSVGFYFAASIALIPIVCLVGDADCFQMQ